MFQSDKTKKNGRGRPKMTEDEKREAKLKRDAKKIAERGGHQTGEDWGDDPFGADRPAAKPESSEEPTPKRQYIRSGVVTNPGVQCFHCRHRYGHKKQHKYPGRQRFICGGCGKPFLAKMITDECA